jgi:Lrp/AsnC family transcriptional regulator, leucine-responsive regulatory protein
MDAIDAKLLTLVQTNARITSQALSEAVGLSATACQRRLNHLRHTGVIEREIAVVSPKAVGRPLMMLVSVTLERERVDNIDRFKAALLRAPEVMQVYYVTGDTDFVLVVTARDIEEYEAFMRRFFAQNFDIKGYKTAVVMNRVKAGFFVPIEPDK